MKELFKGLINDQAIVVKQPVTILSQDALDSFAEQILKKLTSVNVEIMPFDWKRYTFLERGISKKSISEVDLLWWTSSEPKEMPAQYSFYLWRWFLVVNDEWHCYYKNNWMTKSIARLDKDTGLPEYLAIWNKVIAEILQWQTKWVGTQWTTTPKTTTPIKDETL